MKNIKNFKEYDINESKKDSKYPELDEIAEKLVDEVGKLINNNVKDVESKMPYKAQYVLEELIKKLEDII
jgi:hypothetical protein